MLPAKKPLAKYSHPGHTAFKLPPELEASEPPELRGQGRDDVRLMVSHYQDDGIEHTQFKQIPDYLEAGDVIVINTSGTRKASLEAKRPDGERIQLHISTQLPTGEWVVELRRVDGHSTQPLLDARVGEVVAFPNGGSVQLLEPHSHEGQARLWRGEFDLSSSVEDFMQNFGKPIRYNYVPEEWETDYYQTVYANQIGSAEMPSAGRAFTPEIITQLVAKGIVVVPVILHTGVASLEGHEAPYEEYFEVPPITAETVNAARVRGNRIVAVGTTVVRALETQTDQHSITRPRKGWTDLVISPASGIRSVIALLTGFHEPQASHLAMLEALASPEHLERSYSQALEQKYLWHEFGDLHLILP
ncbi:MAG: S-adenosylmethionine:tRNA ribosyltransferase-isomerase [Chloroflexi bacterium]|nr:MAG: S-adenosylmethionine:tRNA ribosyltransferase-isomerase [Chloroflexota bacterium]MBL1193635.1 S-adenosylmethionine:tRNA ribosyltransferase-isomerase [Chloroflexota bacterium]NOH10927.1 S-adenosylmethionine:tRNA ribosyltransferase-isomerase [Chloroflexota bacterium]